MKCEGVAVAVEGLREDAVGARSGCHRMTLLSRMDGLPRVQHAEAYPFRGSFPPPPGWTAGPGPRPAAPGLWTQLVTAQRSQHTVHTH